MSQIPETVKGDDREYYARCNDLRADIKAVAAKTQTLREDFDAHGDRAEESAENVTLAFRHLEDASMRLGKALQALDGGVSVYDRSTTVGA